MKKQRITQSILALLSLCVANVSLAAEEVTTIITPAPLIDNIVSIFEMTGIYTMMIGMLAATFYFFWELIKKPSFNLVFLHYREHLAQAILLGLEILVVANIINTLVLDPTISSFMTLSVVVLVRTFLSFSLSVEAHGFWPWERKKIALLKKCEVPEDRDHDRTVRR